MPHQRRKNTSMGSAFGWLMFRVMIPSASLLALHHPHPIPIISRRVRLKIFAALDIHLRNFVRRVEAKRLAEHARGLIPSLLAVFRETVLELVERLHQVRKALLRVIIEDLVDHRRLCFSLDHYAIDLPAPVGAS